MFTNQLPLGSPAYGTDPRDPVYEAHMCEREHALKTGFDLWGNGLGRRE